MGGVGGEGTGVGYGTITVTDVEKDFQSSRMKNWWWRSENFY